MTRILVACDASWNHRTRQGSIAAILFNEQQQQIVTQAIHITTHDPIDVFELEQLAAVLGVYGNAQKNDGESTN